MAGGEPPAIEMVELDSHPVIKRDERYKTVCPLLATTQDQSKSTKAK